jgi:predicted RNase H-like HicB family nuclease
VQERTPIIGFKIDIVVEPDDTGFHAYCPGLKGLHTCGDTETEALQNAKHAAVAYLQSSISHSDPIPVGVIIRPQRIPIPFCRKKRATYHAENVAVPSVT